MSTLPPDKPAYNFAPILEVPGTPEVHLAITRPEDSLLFFQLLRNNREHLEQYQGWSERLRTLEEVEEYNSNVLWCMQHGSWLQYSIVPGTTAAPGLMVGDATIYEHNPARHTAKFGYLLAKEAQGNGYASRSVATLLAYGKQILGLTEAVAHIAVGNERSERLAEGLGCRVEGIPYLTKVGRGQHRRTLRVRKWVKDLQEAA